MLGRVHSVQVSGGGVPKLPVVSAEVTTLGLAGDKQRDRRYHGGPERAVCLWSLEVIEALTREGHRLVPGATGENVTLAELPWSAIVPGAVLDFDGGPRLEVASYAAPCKHLLALFVDGGFSRISQKLSPGSSRVYARVLAPGLVSTGQHVRLSQRLTLA